MTKAEIVMAMMGWIGMAFYGFTDTEIPRWARRLALTFSIVNAFTFASHLWLA